MGTRVLVIAGPTAVGKTDCSIEVALRVKGEIISSDSTQIYRGCDIGTAKVDVQSRRTIPHHLIDEMDISAQYNMSMFYDRTMSCINEITERDRVPIIVGGNGFYLSALVRGKPNLPGTNLALRETIMQQLKLEDQGDWDRSLARVKDREKASKLERNDVYRLVRLLEIQEQLGDEDAMKVPSTKSLWCPAKSGVDFRCFVLTSERVALNRRIDLRCEMMVRDGLLLETARLLQVGLQLESSIAKAIGYRQAIDFLRRMVRLSESLDSGATFTEGALPSFSEFLKDFQCASREYARKQWNWFKNLPDLMFVDAGSNELLELMEYGLKLSRAEFLSDSRLRQAHEQGMKLASVDVKKEMRSYRSNLFIFNNPVETTRVLEQAIQALEILPATLRNKWLEC